MILGYAGKVAQMFSWSRMLAPPTWFANDPGGTRYGQMNREALQTTFRTRTAKSARLQVSRAHRAEATESDTVRTTINLCRPRPPNDSLRELGRVPIEGGLAAGGAEVERPALVSGAARGPLGIDRHSAHGIFFHRSLERTVLRESSGLSAGPPPRPCREPRIRKSNDLQRFLGRAAIGGASGSNRSLARAVGAFISSRSRNSSSVFLSAFSPLALSSMGSGGCSSGGGGAWSVFF